MINESNLKETINKYADLVKRICFVYLKNEYDTEDIFQNVFLKYYKSKKVFESDEHIKAFLIRITINECKDYFKNYFRKNTIPLDNNINYPTKEKDNNIKDAILNLDEKYRIVILLHYYEGYTAVEISSMLKKNVNTIYTLLSRAREKLKINLGGGDY